MDFNLSDSIAILGNAPHVVRAMLENAPAEWTTANEGGQTWSPFEVVGHLIHAERTDWIPRLRIILEHGETAPFKPFDRFAQKTASADNTLADLLDTFEQLRSENVRQLRDLNLASADLQKRGTHPEFGAVTAEQLLATWLVHDLDHISQISRTMAKQYREAVGPWQAYLSILK